MNIAIVYASKTGNTKLLADEIQACLNKEAIVYSGGPKKALDAQVLFLGSWINQGTFAPEILSFMRTCHNQRIFLFGTAGFGGSEAYFEEIIERTKKALDDTNIIIGSYMCQGKMPESVKQRYMTMLEAQPDNAQIKEMLENFELAKSHPDTQDLRTLRNIITSLR